jgi:hypothetical protein
VWSGFGLRACWDDGSVSRGLLVRGVTLPAVDSELASVWVGVAYQTVREIARVVGPVAMPTSGQNYYALRMRLPDGTARRLMLNAAVRLVGCVEDRDSPDCRVLATRFHDVPRSELFGLAGFVVADPRDMERAVTVGDLAELGPDERRDVTYHRVTRVGDVLFNWFD